MSLEPNSGQSTRSELLENKFGTLKLTKEEEQKPVA